MPDEKREWKKCIGLWSNASGFIETGYMFRDSVASGYSQGERCVKESLHWVDVADKTMQIRSKSDTDGVEQCYMREETG